MSAKLAWLQFILAVLFLGLVCPLRASENVEWKALFDGKTLAGWK